MLHEGGRRRPGVLDLLASAADAGGLGAIGLRPDAVPDQRRGEPHLLAARELGEPCRDHIPGAVEAVFPDRQARLEGDDRHHEPGIDRAGRKGLDRLEVGGCAREVPPGHRDLRSGEVEVHRSRPGRVGGKGLPCPPVTLVPPTEAEQGVDGHGLQRRAVEPRQARRLDAGEALLGHDHCLVQPAERLGQQRRQVDVGAGHAVGVRVLLGDAPGLVQQRDAARVAEVGEVEAEDGEHVRLLPAGARPAGDFEGLLCPLVGFRIASGQHEGARLGAQHPGPHLRLPVVADQLDRPFVGDEGVLAGARVPQVAPEPLPDQGGAAGGGRSAE